MASVQPFHSSPPSQTIRKFSYSAAPRSSSSLYLALLCATLGLLYHSYVRLAFSSCGLLLVCYVSDRNTVVEESLIVIKGTGVQLTKTTKKGTSSHLFLDSTQIKDVIINEGVTPYSVCFYVALVVQNSERMTVPFEHATLSLEQVKEVYYGVRELLLSA